MRLTSLQLSNFRQFYGMSPKLIFAHGDKNVTVIHGMNGAGKTALLNAFTWALYGSFTKGFQFPEQLVNKRAIREAKTGETVEAWVELAFEHNDRKYVIKRAMQVLRVSEEPGYVVRGTIPPMLQSVGFDGNWIPEDRVSDIIGRVLPGDLHTYFFFDGERIERIVQPSKEEQRDLAKATKKLLGIEVLDRAERHLNRANKELEKELEQIGDPETKRLIDHKNDKETQLAELRKKEATLASEIDNHTERRIALEKQLRDLEEVKSDQLRRDHLNQEKQARLDALRIGQDTLAQIVSTHGYAFFLTKASSSYRELIDKLRREGELPAGIKRQFVEDLLRNHECICARDLEEGTPARHAVEEWMKRGGLADVEEKAIRMGGEVAKIEQMLPEVWGRIDQIQEKEQAAREQLFRVEDELETIRERLEKSPKEEVSGLQRELDKVETRIEDAIRDQGRTDREIQQLEQEIRALQDQITKHEANEKRQQLAQRRVDAAIESIRRIVRVRQLLEADFRQALQKRIAKLFHKISYTPYVPELTDQYNLRLLESAGGNPLPVAASQGESQILSLSFIGSIIEQAREYNAKRDRLPGPDSSSYPIVMDSPFGSLDPIYRRQIAENIPVLADQVVVLVSKTQWRGEVEESLSTRINRSYLLTYYSPRPDIEIASMDLAGETYDLVKQSPNDYEYTEIREVAHG